MVRVPVFEDKVEIYIPVGDEATDLATGVSKAVFRLPYGFVLTGLRASVETAPVGAAIQVDVVRPGSGSILSTKINIDAGQRTSKTAASQPVWTANSFADDTEFGIDISQVGSSTAGKGLKVWFIGRRSG